jgi:hypothetical protein
MDKKLPTLKYTISFDVRFSGECFLFLHQNCEDENETPISFVRVNKRWRNANRGASGFYVSSHEIAATLFDYDKQNITKQEIEYMFSFVDALGRVIDDLTYQFERATAKKIAQQVLPISKPKEDYFPEKLVDDVDDWGAEDGDLDDKEKESNHVYLMKHVSGFIKIGSSKNPRTRERTLQSEDPRLDLLFSTAVPRSVESRLHAIFKDLRFRGEWFNLAPHHVDWIMFIFKQQESTHLFKPENKVEGDKEITHG